jgi:hypothetical protein
MEAMRVRRQRGGKPRTREGGTSALRRLVGFTVGSREKEGRTRRGTTHGGVMPRRAPHGELAAGLGCCDELSLPPVPCSGSHCPPPALRLPPAEHSSPDRRLLALSFHPPRREGPLTRSGVSTDARRPYAGGRCGPDAHDSRGSKLSRARRPPHRPRRGMSRGRRRQGPRNRPHEIGGVGGGVCTTPAGALARRTAPDARCSQGPGSAGLITTACDHVAPVHRSLPPSMRSTATVSLSPLASVQAGSAVFHRPATPTGRRSPTSVAMMCPAPGAPAVERRQPCPAISKCASPLGTLAALALTFG